MEIEIKEVKAVRLKVTLKEGEEVWPEGEVLSSPLPKAIIGELKANTGTVEVLSVIEEGKATVLPSTEDKFKEIKPKGRLVV